MRRLIVAAVVALVPFVARADCRFTTGETSADFMSAVDTALAADAISLPSIVGFGETQSILAWPPNNVVAINLVEKDGLLNEADVGAKGDNASAADLDKVVNVSSVMIAHLSHESEQAVRGELVSVIAEHPGLTTFRHEWGETVTSISRITQGFGIRIGKRHCD